MKEKKVLKTLEEIKTFSDPYRLKIITMFKKFERAATVKEIADALNEVPAKIYYHVKKLEKVDMLKLSYTKEINGIIAKYYELTAETYIIQYSETNKELNKVILNETQRAFENQYENSKQIILSEISNIDNFNYNEEDDIDAEIVNQSSVYLSNDDLKELKSLLNRFIKQKQKRLNHKKYHLFSVLFPLSEDNDK